jgi:hypothetical protein
MGLRLRDRSFVACKGGVAAIGDWERVVEVAGHLLQQTDDYPVRHLTMGFPDEADLEAISMGET